ncbi:hypothetical protein ACU063_21840 [Paenibacillus sp. M.A.Huq-81]
MRDEIARMIRKRKNIGMAMLREFRTMTCKMDTLKIDHLAGYSSRNPRIAISLFCFLFLFSVFGLELSSGAECLGVGAPSNLTSRLTSTAKCTLESL